MISLLLQVLLVVGTKLEVIITEMCLKSSQQIIVAPGRVCVKPDDNLFWFGQPQLLLHLIQFILIQVNHTCGLDGKQVGTYYYEKMFRGQKLLDCYKQYIL